MLINTWSSVTLLFFSNYPSKKKKKIDFATWAFSFAGLNQGEGEKIEISSVLPTTTKYQCVASTVMPFFQNSSILLHCKSEHHFLVFFFKSFIELFLKVFLIKNKPKLLTLVLMTGRNVVVYKNSHRNFFIKWMDCLDWSANDTLIIL